MQQVDLKDVLLTNVSSLSFHVFFKLVYCIYVPCMFLAYHIIGYGAAEITHWL